ncbi:MAG TPA: TIGR01777 family oxidoreductase [Acidimicrobiales bacterium]|nr:TIGR01777 family oxidoreductase [Acidimicrobiales bacterium]
MRALVSGSSGLIGSALVARLEAGGHVVHRLVRRPPEDGEAAIDVAARTIDASRLPGQSLEGLDAVFNLAGEPLAPESWRKPPRWSPAKKERIWSSRVETTELLASVLAGLDKPPAVLVSASATGYYGDRGDELLVEGTLPGTGFLPEVCVAWEAATAPATEAGIRTVALRTGMVLAAEGGFLKMMLPLFRRGLGARIGGGWQWMSWISLDDEVGALLHAATRDDLSGPVNAVSPEPVRNRDLTLALAEAVGRPALLSVPEGPLRMAFGIDAAVFALASQRVVPRRLERSGYEHVHPQLAGALRAALASPAAAGHPHRAA